MRYCFDTSGLMDGTRYYRPKNFPTIWTKLDELVEAQEIVSIAQVLTELEKRADDELHQWAKKRSKMFLPLDDRVQENVRAVMSQFPRFCDGRPSKNFADPFVIALAMDRELVLVTGERRGGTADRPTIPIVCNHFDVDHITLTEMIEREAWTL